MFAEIKIILKEMVSFIESLYDVVNMETISKFLEDVRV